MPRVRKKGGGRAARIALRSEENKENKPAPIRAGFSGGQYKPLTDEEALKIHHTALDVLEQIGMGRATPRLIEMAKARGCWVNDRGRLCFPKPLMEEIIAGACKSFTLYARDPKHDLEISGSRVHFGTGGAAISVHDFKTGYYRPSTLADIYDFARLSDQLSNIHWFTRPVIATELPDPYELDINTAYVLAAATKKHLGTAITIPENVAPVTDLFDIIAGGPGKFAERPFCKLHSCPIVPPLNYGPEAVDTIWEGIQRGWTINSITAGQSGATAPAPLAGALVQTHAETLASLAMVNIFKPGHPFIFGNWPFVADLRTGAMTGGSAEGGLLNSGAAQLANMLNLPSGVAGGMPDSKIPDAQSGYESALPNVMIGLAGANLVYESAGMRASILGSSYEAYVIDNEALSSVLRAVRGIEVTEETLSFDVIKEAVAGPGHFLGSDQTIAVMETEYVYPDLGDRQTPDMWQDAGAQDLWQKARTRVQELMKFYPEYLTPEQDQAIRAQFDIKIAPEEMRAGSGRW